MTTPRLTDVDYSSITAADIKAAIDEEASIDEEPPKEKGDPHSERKIRIKSDTKQTDSVM